MAWVFRIADVMFLAGQVFASAGLAYGAYLALSEKRVISRAAEALSLD